MHFDEILLTGRVIAITLAACFAVGLPAVVAGSLVIKIRPKGEDCWLYAPLVGAGLIILFCQNLLYADVPVPKSAVVLWLFAATGWIWMLASASRRNLVYSAPWLALGIGVVIYLIQAGGLLSLGASNYYGYGWGDMFNYVSMAQFFADFPFHSDIANQGYLQAAQGFKLDRIGQSVLHSFLMVSSATDAQQSFGTTILLSPFLMFFGFLAIARRLLPASPVFYLAAFAGALSPTVATIHLECFFSQSMCIPFLLLWPLAVSQLVETPGWRSALVAGLLMSVICAIYTEVVPIVLAIAVVCSVVKDLSALQLVHRIFLAIPDKAHGRPFASTLPWLLLAVLVGAVSDVGYTHSAFGIFFRTTTGNVLADLYPWAFKPEGVARLWLGNQVPRLPGAILGITIGVTVLIFVCNLISLTAYAKRFVSILFLALLLLMFIPLGPLVAGGGSRYPYQFYKLLLTITPIHAFWFVLGGTLIRPNGIFFRNWASVTGVCLAAVNGLLTFSITRASAYTSTVSTSHRGGAHLLITPDFALLRKLLAQTQDRDVLTLWYDNELYSGAYRTEWINYFARHDRVRSMNRTVSGQTDVTADSIDARFSKENLKPLTSALVVTWKSVDDLKDRLVLATPLVSVYDTRSQQDMRRLIDVARVTFSRKLMLDATSMVNPASLYPVWVAGKPGNASLLTMKFGEFNQFRYDQWGYPALYLTPMGECRGKRMSLEIQLQQLDRRLRIECNGAVAEANLSLAYSSLDQVPVRYGWSAGIGPLEDKYPIEANFPGSVVEKP